MFTRLPTGVDVAVSAAYPNHWPVQQAIAEVYDKYGVMTYCKIKTLRKFGEVKTYSADTDATVSIFYNGVINEIFSTSNDITHAVSDNVNDTQKITLEGHFYDANNRKIFHIQKFTLNGQTPVELPTPLCRATRYEITTVKFGSEPADLAGNISIYVGEGTTVVNGVIDVSQDTRVKLYGDTNQSRKGSTSMSYFDFYVITDVSFNAEKAAGQTAIIDYDIHYREEGGVFLPVGLQGSLRTASQSSEFKTGNPFMKVIPRNSDITPIISSSVENVPMNFHMNGFILHDINGPDQSISEEEKEIIVQSLMTDSDRVSVQTVP